MLIDLASIAQTFIFFFFVCALIAPFSLFVFPLVGISPHISDAVLGPPFLFPPLFFSLFFVCAVIAPFFCSCFLLLASFLLFSLDIRLPILRRPFRSDDGIRSKGFRPRLVRVQFSWAFAGVHSSR